MTASTAPAIRAACESIRRELLALVSAREEDVVLSEGRITWRSDPSRSIDYDMVLADAGRTHIEAEATSDPEESDDAFAYQSFGAHFVETELEPDIARLRVTRVVSVFDAGRILNPQAARSQLIGGIVFGIGAALLEELVYDRAHGQLANGDLAGYLVPVNADVPAIDVSWIGEPDFRFNPIGCRGVGEIGVVGMSAAIANSVFHATGRRIRELPISIEKLL